MGLLKGLRRGGMMCEFSVFFLFWLLGKREGG
jgi:hypothetical protein